MNRTETMLQFKGRPVPYVTRWTSEVIPPQLITMALTPVAGGGERLHLSGATPDDYIDEVLWLPERDLRGAGTPMWKDFQSHRQQDCMARGRCQVCGLVMTPPITWLIPGPTLLQREGQSRITDVPPTCIDCVPVAMEKCPHMRFRQETATLYEVKFWRAYAVFGDILERDSQGRLRLHQGEVRVNAPDQLRHVLARTQVVEWLDFRKRTM